MGARDARERGRELLAGLGAAGGELGPMDGMLPALSAFVAEHAAPGFECKLVGAGGRPEQRFPGVEGIAAAWEEWSEAFENVSNRLEGIEEHDDAVVLMIEQVVTTRHQGVRMSQPSAMLIGFEDEGVARVEFHLDRAQALRSAGAG